MWRPGIHNHTFDWMGDSFAPVIDREHFLGHSSIGNPKWKLPPANVKQTGQLFEMEVLVPGFEKNEVEITVQDDILTISGKKSEKRTEASKYVLEEFGVDSFERRFRLGDGIGHEHIEAELKNGILHIAFTDVPKEQEKKYQEIEVS